MPSPIKKLTADLIRNVDVPQPEIAAGLADAFNSDPWYQSLHPDQNLVITGNALFKLLCAFFSAWPDLEFQAPYRPETRTMLSDRWFYCIPHSALVALMQSSPLPPPQGALLPELTDCDDYALSLKVEVAKWLRKFCHTNGVSLPAPAIGLIFTGDHAICVFVSVSATNTLAVGICDPSDPSLPVRYSIDQRTRALFKKAPIRWLFF